MVCSRRLIHVFRGTLSCLCLLALASALAQPPSAVSRLNPHFAAASVKFDIPLPLLKAVSYVETRWQMVRASVEFEGVPAAFGVMALRGPKLAQGARLAQVSVERVRSDPRANIFAGAALLRAYADDAELRCGGLEAWRPVLLRYSGVTETRSRDYYMREIARILQEGVTMQLEGSVVASIKPEARLGCR